MQSFHSPKIVFPYQVVDRQSPELIPLRWMVVVVLRRRTVNWSTLAAGKGKMKINSKQLILTSLTSDTQYRTTATTTTAYRKKILHFTKRFYII